MRFVIGEIVVDVVVDDDDFELPLGEFLPGLDLPALSQHRGLLEPDFVDLARNTLKCAIQTFVVRVDGRTLLVDTCIGEHKDRPEIPAWDQRSGTGFLERLRRAGVDPAAVDAVFCTHLHIDHVGWNTQRADGRWTPIFPNARYLVGRTELADWLARRDAGTAAAMHVRGLEDSVLPVMEAGLVDLVDDGHELARGLVLAPLPGHTMGQMGLRIDRSDGRAIFCGDAMHNPVQICQPGVSTSSCIDPDRAAATRRALLEEPRRPAGWWCRRIFAAGAERRYARPAPLSRRFSMITRRRVVARPERPKAGRQRPVACREQSRSSPSS